MPAVLLAWVIAQAPSFAISLAISILQKTGIISTLQAEGLKVGSHVLKVVESVQTYSAPDDFPKPAGVRN